MISIKEEAMGFVSKQYLFITVATVLFLCGCGKKFTNNEQSPIAPPIDNPIGVIPGTPGHADDVVDPTDGVWSSGGTAVFKPASYELFNQWVSAHPVEPQNALINVNLVRASGKATYYGEVKIRYQHSGNTYEATLRSGTSGYKGQDFYQYNYWFQNQGQTVFSGFFEDKVGAIVLVVNNFLDLGDGGGASQISGEVWFKNFTSSWATYDQGGSWSVVLPCWFRSIGPFDCRSESVMKKNSLYPTDRYQKLGTFSNMNKLKAFSE